jgi:hypothetical protein
MSSTSLSSRNVLRVPKEIVEQQELEIESDLSYVEHPMKILDTKERSTRRAKVKMYKIQWNNHTEEEATWETTHYLQQTFPDFLRTNSGTYPSNQFLWNLGTRFFLGGKAVTLQVSSY